MISNGDSEITTQAQSQELLTAGQMLRHAREAAGIHVATLAVALKVSVKKIEALESGELQYSMDPVFVRALASSVCRHLNINPNVVLANLPLVAAPRLSSSEGAINAPFHRDTDPVFNSWKDFLLHRTFLIVSGILSLALLIYLLPNIEKIALDYEPIVSHWIQRIEVRAVSEIAHESPHNMVDPNQSTQPPASQPVAQIIPEVVESPPSELSAVQMESPKTPEKAEVIAGTAANVQGGQPMQNAVAFRATQESWVEVIDGGGRVLLRKLLAPSEMVAASGQYPLSVVVGKAAVTEVWVHGKPYDLIPITRENVARFEVKF